MVPSRRALGVLAALFVVGCHSDKTGPEVLTPSSIAASGSTSFTGTVGSALATPPAVLVMAKDGKPVPGATVTFAVTAGGGSVVGASAPTNTQGIATVGAWVLGKAPATPNTLTATVSGLSPVTFTATGAVGSASKLAAVSGDGQAGDVGSPMPNPFVVRVTDAFDNPIVNAPVTFALTSGSGTLVPSNTTTDAQGRASSTITLSAAGPTSITASSSAVTGVSVPFNVSTGPTIQGKVTAASGLVRPFSTGRGVASASSNIAAERRSYDRSLPGQAPESRALLVMFRPTAFALPASAQAYRSRAVAQRAVDVYIGALASYRAANVLDPTEISPAIGTARVRIGPGQRMDSVIALLSRDSRIASVERDEIVSLAPHGVAPIPNVASTSRASAAPLVSSELYPSDPLAQFQLWHYAMIDAPRAWALQTGSANVTVAVIDVGIRPTHPAMRNMLTADQYDFVSNTVAFSSPQSICGTNSTFTSLRGTSTDEALPRTSALQPTEVYLASSTATCWTRDVAGGHGTHTAGTIGSAANDATGGTGINWNVRIKPIRALGIMGSGFTFDIAQAILYAAGLPAAVPGSTTQTVQTTPSNIISLSLGGPSAAVVANAVTAASANALIIASSGNSPTTTPNYPAAYPEVVSVAALGPDYSLASYSTIGSTVDLVAPGGDFRFGIGSGGVASSTWNYVTDEANYTYYEGTSMAAPHVAGVAALVLAANPGLTPAQLRVRLEAGAIDLGPPGRDNRYGWGVVNAFNSITGRTSAATSTLVSAVDATTGAVARTVPAGADGGFSLTRLPSGSYFVVAGQDEANDKKLGIPGRRFSWSGAPALASVPLTATSLQSIAIGLGAPVEIEPNNDAASAQMLVIDSWVAGQISAPDVRDVYQFIVPAAGTYTVETSGVLGSCGNALELDTRLRLLDASGVEVANNDDTSFPAASYPGSYCSRISMTLQPGRYTVEVLATSLVKSSVNTQGQYRLHIRSGA